MKFERAKRAIEQTPQVTDDESAVARSAGSRGFCVYHPPLRSTPGWRHMKFKRAKRLIAQTPLATDDESAVAHSAG